MKDLKDLIKNAVDDIKQDIDELKMDCESERRKNPPSFTNHSTPEDQAWFHLFIPHLLGIVLGLAVARLFHCGFLGYIFFGIVFAFLAGVWKSYELDNIRLKNAVIKNALLMGIGFVILFAAFIVAAFIN